MEVKHDQFIGIYENAISHEWCDKVIDYFEKAEKYSNRVTVSFTRDKACGLWYNKGLINEFKNSLVPVYEKYIDKYPWVPGREGLFITDYKIQKTLPTEGYHVWHIEHGKGHDNEARAFVFSIYLNDVKEGGETEFLHFSKRVQPKTGRIVIWPAAFPYLHRGNSPLSGKKYILTSWIMLR